MNDLFPKPKRRMLQPTKDALRLRLANAEADFAAEHERAESWKATALWVANRGPVPFALPEAHEDQFDASGRRLPWARSGPPYRNPNEPPPGAGAFVLIDAPHTPHAPWWRRLFRRTA
jgi:hypothetical protein